MNVDTLKKIWSLINGLGGTTKTILIIILCGFLLIGYVERQNEAIIKQYSEYVDNQQMESENYTLKMAPEINACIDGISTQDTSAVDVMLLGYHNSKKTLQGFSYVYLDYLTEKINSLYQKPLKNHWRDLEYIYYADELCKIHNLEFLRVQNIEDMKGAFPKLYERVCESGAKAVAFYTITGTQKRQLGMVVLFYNKPKDYYVGYYNTAIAPYIQQLAAILDYSNIKERIKN